MRYPGPALFFIVVVGLAGAPAVAGAGDAPRAHAAAKCGNVKTANGGTAKFVNGNEVQCVTARRVARRAKGRTYKASGFTCKVNARFYSCFKPGTAQGIGFSYVRP